MLQRVLALSLLAFSLSALAETAPGKAPPAPVPAAPALGPASRAPVSDPAVNTAPHDKWARGTVAKVDKGALVIQDDQGQKTTLQTDDKTRVYTEQGQAQEGLALVQEGSRVMAAYDDQSGSLHAVRVDVWLKDPQGALKQAPQQGSQQQGTPQPGGQQQK